MTDNEAIVLVRTISCLLELLGIEHPLTLGEASTQVGIPLGNGSQLRIGITDDDVAEPPGGLWARTYFPTKPPEVSTDATAG